MGIRHVIGVHGFYVKIKFILGDYWSVNSGLRVLSSLCLIWL